MRTSTSTALLLATLLLAAAGCGPPTEDRGVASADRSRTAGPTATVSPVELGRQHARCMRENGVPEADPEVDAAGNVTRIGGGYDKQQLDQNVLAQAIEKCQAYEVPLDIMPGADLKKESARLIARCMRDNGVENYPDPGSDGRPARLSDEVRADPQYDSAMRVCDEEIAKLMASHGVTPK